MKLLSDSIAAQVGKASLIRRMFDAGAELKAKFGAENVFDFSLGNPDLPPPAAAKAALHEIADHICEPRAVGYPSNAGWTPFREALAKKLATEQNVPSISASNIIVSCGAAGAITSFFRAVLNQGDEIICPSPYFVEYGSYCGHFGGILRPVPSKRPSFDLDLDAIAAAITPSTRVIMFNSPNNPTGCIYSEATVSALAALVARENENRERPIFILSDEPYRFLAYGGAKVPSVLDKSPFAVVLGSFSKSLSMPGERVGYLAASPSMPEGDKLIAAVTITTRTLGFVNAPLIGQKLATAIIDSGVDLSIYEDRRKKMAAVLDAAGLRYTMPQGAFYFFPEVPGGDDFAFTDRLFKENILVVPGSGFGCPGYIRLSFSVETDSIVRSAEGFVRAAAAFK